MSCKIELIFLYNFISRVTEHVHLGTRICLRRYDIYFTLYGVSYCKYNENSLWPLTHKMKIEDKKYQSVIE